MKKIRAYRYILRGGWNGVKFEHSVVAESAEIAERQLRQSNESYKLGKIEEFELRESLDVYVSEN